MLGQDTSLNKSGFCVVQLIKEPVNQQSEPGKNIEMTNQTEMKKWGRVDF